MKISYPISFLCVPEYKKLLKRCRSQRFLSNLFDKYTPVCLFYVCLKTRGSKKNAIQSCRQWYHLWRKGTCFPNKPTATTPLGSGFPLPWSCSLHFFNLIYTSLIAQCVPLDIDYKSLFNPKHILVPSIKRFKFHQLPWQKWPTSSKACLNTWKNSYLFEKSVILQNFLCV